jgi:predicted permease
VKLWHWFSHRSQEDRELEEELQFHLAEEARLRKDGGEAPEAARRSALLSFGNYVLAKEVTRGMWGWTSLERTAEDLRFAMRMLRKSPAFTVLALTALALGIGATTAMFSVVSSILLKPLPFPDPRRLVMIWERPPQSSHRNVVQTQNFLDWRRRNHSFEDVAAVFQIPFNLEGSGDPVQVPALRVSAGFFEILGRSPLLGRAIGPTDDVPDTPWVVVLSYGLWQRRFGGRRDVIGQKIAGPGNAFEVIGVMAPDFYIPSLARADLYLPLRIRPDEALRDGRNYKTVARLRPGVSQQAAQSDIAAIAAQTAEERPEMNAKWSATVVPLMEQTVGDTRTTLLVLFGAVAFVLLIACANVSNLLLIRAHARRPEMAVRIALGAGRWRLLHQLVIESLLLAFGGGLLGFLLAWFGVPALVHMLPEGFPLPRMAEIGVDRSVLAFTMALSLGCGIVFGAFPALQLGRGRVNDALQQGGRQGSASGRHIRSALVVAEVSLAMLLVIGAGLMLRSFALLNAVDPGFQPERLLTFRMVLVPSGWKTFDELLAQRAALIEQMLTRIRSLPEVASASSISFLPLSGSQSGTAYYRADRPAPPLGAMPGGDTSVVSDGYFRTMGIPLLAGREFEERDRLLGFERSHIDREAVLHIGLEQSLVGFVDLLDRDDFDIGGDVVRAAKIEHLLGLGMPPMGEPERLRRPNIRPKTGHGERLLRRADQRDVAVAAEQLNVGVDVVIGGNGVEDEVEAAGVLLHLVRHCARRHFVRAQPQRVFLLAGRGREDDDVSSQRVSELHAHVAQSAETHHADFLAFGDAPVAHGRVRCDSGAEQRRGSGKIRLEGTCRTKRSSTTTLSE